ncbi:MAG: class I SAM-dependent methyltransferase, partial [Vicinamibacterales bacterium]
SIGPQVRPYGGEKRQGRDDVLENVEQRDRVEPTARVDPNPWAVEQAHARGVEAYVGSVDAIDASRRFDAIALLDVLEHVVAPLPFLAAVRARLRPDGRLLIMTPNIRSLLARLSGRRWVSLKVPEHVRYYSPRSIRALLRVAGFDVLAVRPAGQYVTIAFVLSRLERLVPGPARALRKIADALALGGRTLFLTNGSIDVIARPSGGVVDSTRTRR